MNPIEFLIQTAYNKADIYRTKAIDSLDSTDLAHYKAYLSLGEALKELYLENIKLKDQDV